jgi:hypothetical protein
MPAQHIRDFPQDNGHVAGGSERRGMQPYCTAVGLDRAFENAGVESGNLDIFPKHWPTTDGPSALGARQILLPIHC